MATVVIRLEGGQEVVAAITKPGSTGKTGLLRFAYPRKVPLTWENVGCKATFDPESGGTFSMQSSHSLDAHRA